MNIIGFSGLAGSGKDTAADYLINTYGDCFRKLSFGDAVKDIAAVAFGWDRKLLQGYYLASDLLVFPSTFDMASITQVEASAHKKPAVVVRGSCSGEQIIDNENGFLCEENSQSLADKLFELCNNNELVKTVGENAYKTLYRTWDTVGKDVSSAYREIIEDYRLAHPNKTKKKNKK